MKMHILKAEVSPKVKLLLSEEAKTQKRSLKKQVEYILERHVTEDVSFKKEGVPDGSSKEND
jgi:hypothetical protein